MKTSYANKMKLKKWWRFLAAFVVVCLLVGEMSLPVMATDNEMLENSEVNEAEVIDESVSAADASSVTDGFEGDETEGDSSSKASKEVEISAGETEKLLILNQEETLGTEAVGGLVWYKFIPEESGLYKLSTSGSTGAYIALYDAEKQFITDLRNDESDVYLQYNLEMGNIYYFCIELFTEENATILLEQKIAVTSAELVSFKGCTTVYYEFLSIYDFWGFCPSEEVIQLNLEDGTSVEAHLGDDVWKDYEIVREPIKIDGYSTEYDENNKLPIGDYYIKYTISGKDYGVSIPYYVRSIEEAEIHTLALNQVYELSTESVVDPILCKYMPEESGLYTFSVIENNNVVLYLYNSNGDYITSYAGTNAKIQYELEAGSTYYYFIAARDISTISVLLEQEVAVVDAEIVSYTGETMLCYEFQRQYNYGIK